MALSEGDFLTDGATLFEFRGFLPDGEGVMLENSSTDRVWSIPMRDFVNMKLAKVTPLTRGTDPDKVAA